MTHLILLLPFIYFAIAWFFPWNHFQWESSISVSYVFDILFVITTSLVFKLNQLKFFWHPRGLIARSIAIIFFAVFTIFMVNLFGLKTPFKYIENLFLQLLILAPIIEELVFRHTFFALFEKKILNKNINMVLNSFLFSISHLPALWLIPDEFQNFIILQLFYTFVLGWLCSKSRLKSRAVYEPVFLHFIFNLTFYFAVINGAIL